MPQIINTNIASINAQRNLNNSQSANQTALQRLSSGLRINSAKDDAAGLAISTRFTSQVRGLNVAIRNAGDGVSLAQTAEGALGAMTENLLRIRDLALQSANATNSDVDRQALNEEVQQLKEEIQRLADQTNFNGTKLLDGTFQDVTFQIGANKGESITFGIAGATVDELGTAQTDGISSEPSTADMEAGDLVINGIAVPASTGVDDIFSAEDNSSSAIAKVAAINKVTDQTGIKAFANSNSLGGSFFSATTATSSSGTIVINNVSINLSISTTLSEQVNLQNIATSINEKSGETGVRAVYDGNPDKGITLVADDGRNITIDSTSGDSTITASNYGLASATGVGASTGSITYSGSFTLVSDDGSDIDLDTTTGNIENAGLQVGTFSGNNSGAVSETVNDLAMVTGDLVINGVPIGPSQASDDTASSTGKESSAIAKAAAINKVSEQTGVTAQVNSSILVADTISTSTTADESGSFTLNGVEINVSWNASDSLADRQRAIATAVNNKAGQTGITAEAFGDTYRLIAEDGRNIVLTTSTTTGGSIIASDIGQGTTASATITQRGSVTLLSAGEIELDTITGDIENSGFEVGTYGSSEDGQLIRDVDISTVDGALEALAAVDNALNLINLQRAELGAIQNRFESTIDNQRVASENLTAANSRIRDADFAAETAELSRSQVLQSAGLSILSQANAQPQQVLQLLQG
ncbi:flagellin [Hahella ganghwensis]|uniref:flagellin N-terminal helical domain-containing protein n=1 Tax=Hahella ganghwensis TaxID=286420 RepID=UPI00035E5120|nr:flagellin [Hahella ganghwensis]